MTSYQNLINTPHCRSTGNIAMYLLIPKKLAILTPDNFSRILRGERVLQKTKRGANIEMWLLGSDLKYKYVYNKK